jgi:transposase
MTASPRTLTLAEAADALGVAPARVRALLANGALQPAPGHTSSVPAADVDALVRRGVLRSLDVAAVEGALDRALRRRLPELLEQRLAAALEPVADELAAAVADVDTSAARVATAEEQARAAEAALVQAQERVVALEARIAALEAQPVGLFRRRRSVATA